ncbi:MAG: serine/threonine protein kinase [Muribaculaceae bacterium]|nr:serine/threonine protein kinase [Muribaculaceae bacterium]
MTDLKQGTVVNNRYTLLEYKGRGSFGEVWLAHDNTLDIEVALKIYISLDQRGVEEFKTEYTTTLGLSHPTLLTASFFDVWEHRPYLVMKFCEHGSSSSRAGVASELEVWQFIHDVADGLAYLHDQPEPIIHQDIKPDNILVSEDMHFLITDFGISKRVRSTMRKQSGRAIGAGATAYMGPERFSQDAQPVKASDIWSLGVSAYELATGELPFSGMGGGMQRNGAERPHLPQGWSANLDDIIRRCMELETWDRPTARELSEYTARVLDGDNISYDEWKNGPKENVKKSARKVVIGIVAGIIGVAAIAFIVFSLMGRKLSVEDDNTRIINRYQSLYELASHSISVGNAQNVNSLYEAQALMDSLEYYKEEYPDIKEIDESDIDALASQLNSRLAEASAAWARSADGQYSVAEDMEAAIEHYHVAARLKDTPDINAALSKIEKSTGCRGAMMVALRAQLTGNVIAIDYKSLADAPINDLSLTYKIKSGNTSLVDASSNVNILPGRNRTVKIALPTATDIPTDATITLYNKNLAFATLPITIVNDVDDVTESEE